MKGCDVIIKKIMIYWFQALLSGAVKKTLDFFHPSHGTLRFLL